jgi:hypothetical protein
LAKIGNPPNSDDAEDGYGWAAAGVNIKRLGVQKVGEFKPALLRLSWLTLKSSAIEAVSAWEGHCSSSVA